MVVAVTGHERRRPGRWRTGEESRRRVLAAARDCFGRLGYDRATVRTIAADAGVDPAMVYYFFGTKSALFAELMALPLDPVHSVAALVDGGVEGLGVRMARGFLSAWDGVGGAAPMVALLRSSPTDDRSAEMFREFVQNEIVAQLRRVIAADDAHLRAELVGSHLIGLALARYVVRLEPVASASPEVLAAWIGPVLQHYLTGPDPEHPIGAAG